MTYKIPKHKVVISAKDLERLLSYTEGYRQSEECCHYAGPEHRRYVSSLITRTRSILIEHKERTSK